MTTVQKGDKVSRLTNVYSETQKVFCKRTVKPDKASPIGYIVEWTLDFSKCTPEQVLKLAADSIVIVEQQKFRSAKQSERQAMLSNGWLNRTIDVPALLTGQRVKKTTEQKVQNELDSVSVEERKRIVRAEMVKLGLIEEEPETEELEDEEPEDEELEDEGDDS